MMHRLTKISLSVFVVLQLGFSAQAQGLRTNRPFAPLMFTDGAAAAAANLPERAIAGSGRVARFNEQAIASGRLRLELQDGRTLTAERRNETRSQRGERSWVGEFEGMPGSLMVVTQLRGMVNGFIHYGAETWEIEAVRPGYSHIFRVDEGRLPPEGPILPSPHSDSTGTGSPSSAPAATEVITSAVVVQDLLVVYTPAAATANGGTSGIESKILSAIAAANQAYVNSQVGIQLNLVGLQQIAYTETGDMGVALSRLAGTTDGFMDGVHALRTSLGADLVALINTDNNYCGIAYLGGPNSGASAGFSVTSPNCFGGHTFAHELGHNQGNAHDRASSNSGAYPYSFGYRTCDYPALANGQSFRTVMAYSCTGTPRVNYFSNPNLTYNNAAPMGISYEADPANAADNARSMNAMATRIAGYRAAAPVGLPAAPSAVVAGTPGSDRVTLTWTDNASNESGFVVQRATAGGGFSDRITLGANVATFTDTGLAASTTYSYQVRAYNSNGNSLYSNTVTVTTAAAPPTPAAPTPVTMTVQGSGVTVAWGDVEGETGYEVVRETFNSRRGTWAPTTLTAAANATSLSQSLSAGTYRYKVRALNASGASAFSAAQCATSTAPCSADRTSFTIAKARR